MIFKGAAETDNEAPGDAEDIAKDSVESHLQISLGVLERAHGLGRKHPGANRAIFSKFLSYKSKEVLHNASRLENAASPTERVSQDFSPRTRLSRQKVVGVLFTLH